MGYRAQVITQHRDYGSSTFSDWDKFMYEFIPAMDDAMIDVTNNDSEDFFEIERSKLQEYVDSLPDNEEQSVYSAYTNRYLKMVLQDAIDESKGVYVSWEWF